MRPADWIALVDLTDRIIGRLLRRSPLPQPPEMPHIESNFFDQVIEGQPGNIVRASAIYSAYATERRLS